MSERLIDRIRAVADWERDNPAVAAAWNGALAEKRVRERAGQIRSFLAEQEARAPEFLRSCGLQDREIAFLLSGGMRRWKSMEAVSAFGAQAHEKDAKTFLLLAGEVGTGKTIAATSYFLMAGKTSYEHPDLGTIWQWSDRSCLYRDARDLAREGIYSDEEKRAEGRMKACRALVIDELGAETMTEIWLSRLEGIIDARYRVKLPTILASNLDRTRFCTLYGARIWRRVREAGMSPRLEPEQEDRRVAG